MAAEPRELSGLLQPKIVQMVRLGSPHDGGCLAPVAALHRSVSVVLLGLKDDWSSEEAVVKRQAAAIIHSYDPTVTPAAMLASLQLGVRSLLALRDLALWGRTRVIVGYYWFFRGESRRHYREWVKLASAPAGSTSISKVLTRVGQGSGVLLKVDIEGDEYGVLNDFISDPRAADIVGIFVKYHDLDAGWHEFIELQTRLLRNYHLVHVHANNINTGQTDRAIPRVLEVSYLRWGADWPEGLHTHLPLRSLDFS